MKEQILFLVNEYPESRKTAYYYIIILHYYETSLNHFLKPGAFEGNFSASEYLNSTDDTNSRPT